MVPEIGLTPQTVQRFRQRLGLTIDVLHSGITDRARQNTWLRARDGEARVIIGTRSAIFLPLKNPGLIIVDEEHDASYKQQDGLRYSARDLALIRAQRLDVPVVLGSATPSMESLANAQRQRYTRLSLPLRAGSAKPPRVQVVDLRARPLTENLSAPLVEAMREHLARGEQVLLFLNRRGYAPTLICHACGWTAQCQRCDATLTVHHQSGQLRCHHCGSVRSIPTSCTDCGTANLRMLGYGTERTEQVLGELFDGVPVSRVDRDTMARKDALENLLNTLRQGGAHILIGTQMLTKGHDFPNITLVGVLNADHGIHGTDFRAPERMAQMVIQVTGRAGRGDKAGRVLLQTYHPEHPLFVHLMRQDYTAFAAETLSEREAAELPPFSHMALLRAESPEREQAMTFLQAILPTSDDEALQILGPLPAPMEKRAGRFRAQLILMHPQRVGLQRLLQQWIPAIEQHPLARKVRWSIDVDPQDTF